MKVYKLSSQKNIEKIASQFKDRLVIIDFWSPECGPCLEMKPIYADYARQHQDGIFLSVNIDECTEMIDIYNIQAMPMFVFIKNHEVIDYMIGADDVELLNKINKNLKHKMPIDVLERPKVQFNLDEPSQETEYNSNPQQEFPPNR